MQFDLKLEFFFFFFLFFELISSEISIYSQLSPSQSLSLSQTTDISSKFSDARKFTLRYQEFEITRIEKHLMS